MANIFDEIIEANNNIILTQFPGSTNTGDNDNKRASIIQFKGFDSNIQEGVLGSITVSHSGSVTDHKGKIKFNINDGSSINNLHNIMTIGPAEIKNSGALQASTNSPATITLAATASSTDDFYNNYNLKITSGNGIAQVRKIIDYVGSSKIATLESNWTTIPTANDTYEILASSVSIIGDLNVSSIIASTNTTISDNMIELNTGAASNTHDSGILIERGSTGNNAFMGWDESEDRFILGTTTAINTDTGDLTISPSPLEISNLFLKIDAAAINFGADSDVSLTHVHDTGILLNCSSGNTNLTIKSSNTSDGEAHLTMISDNGADVGDGFQIKTINGRLTIASDHNSSGTYGETILTLTGHDTDNSRAVAITGSLDVTGDTSVSTFDSSGATSLATGGGIVNIASPGQMTTVEGTLNVDEAVTLDSTLSLVSDGVVLNFGADSDVSLTHVHDTGILLNTDKQIQFRDSDIYIHSNSDGNMTLRADTGINLNINNNDKVNITTNTTTFGTNIIIPDSATIGSTSSNSALAISNTGNITIGSGNIILTSGNGIQFNNSTHESIYVGTIPTNVDDTAKYNVGVGKLALNSLNPSVDNDTNADKNTCIGYQSGNSITTGYLNTIMGYQSGSNLVDGNNVVCIGNNSQAATSNSSNEITLGNSNTQTLRCGTTTIASLSDKRDKTNIKESKYGLDFINSLKPVEFTWNRRILEDTDNNCIHNGKKRIGFLAQDLQESMKPNENEILDLVYDVNPERIEAKYGNLIPILTKAIQELNQKIKILENK
jgi:hypothetical protein